VTCHVQGKYKGKSFKKMAFKRTRSNQGPEESSRIIFRSKDEPLSHKKMSNAEWSNQLATSLASLAGPLR
jgi:hypothetical protein